MLGMLLGLGAVATAGTFIDVDAHVHPNLRVVTGTLTVSSDAPFTLVDPLSRWPEPVHDRELLRTYPGAPDQGSVLFAPDGEGRWNFRAELPRRYGDVGAIGRFGLFANGAWYPQPLVDGGVPVADFTVEVTLPPDTLGAVGDRWGRQAVSWEGRGERASLAVLPRGTATRIHEDAVAVTLLTRGEPRPALVRELAAQLDQARPPGVVLTGVVVEAPLRRRLARGGVGLAYVSDRAWRVSPGLHRFHHVATTRGILSGLLPIPDPFVREVAAAAASRRHSALLAGTSARGALAWASWLPVGDALLNDRTLPFVGDVLEDVRPGDPLRDDLLEVWDPHTPGTVAVARLEHDLGPGPTWELATSLLADGTADPVPPAELEALRAPGQGLLVPTPTEARSPLKVTASGWIDTIGLSPAFIEATGAMALRRRADNRDIWSGSLATNRANLLSARIGYTRRQGRQLDGLRRPHAVTAWVNPAILNPSYAELDGQFALGGGLSWRWDDRVALHFPLRGRSLGAGVDGGFVPGTDQRWGAIRATAGWVGSPHPRHAFAARGSVGLADGDVLHRLLPLGGGGALRSLPYGTAIGTRRAVAIAEYRWAPLRNASVPLLFGWGSELQLTAGGEIGTVLVDGKPASAAGVTMGIAGQADLFGAVPRMIGVTLAWPVWTDGIDLVEREAPGGVDPALWPVIYLRWGQAF